MATLAEKMAEVAQTVMDGQAVVSGQIAGVEAQVEALFALVSGSGQLTPEQEAAFEALKSDITASFESLRGGVEQIGVDSPDV